MIQWMYRYLFRGFGVLLAIGMITLLILAFNSQTSRPAKRDAVPGARR